MVDMTGSNFFEEDDEFFADAFRSVSELETSSLKAAEKNNLEKPNKAVPDSNLFTSTRQNQSLNSSSGCSSSCNNYDFSATKSSQVSNNCHNIPYDESSRFPKIGNCGFDEHYSNKCTPKATKRKFSCPAESLIEEPSRKLSIGNSDILKNSEDVELELETIKSSQFSVDELLETVSWKRLQGDISSNHSFLSSAKHFNVQRVLSDTSKKRLPKHIVVPILCLYVKKFSSEEPVSTYMDCTGEISGKVDKEVLELYRDYIKAGTSLILRKVTFVCNIMLLEMSSLVSIYLDNGTVHHIQNWDTIVEKESSNSLSCIFPVTPKVLEKSARRESLKTTPVLKQVPNRSSELVKASNIQTSQQKKLGHSNLNSPQTSHFGNSNAINHQTLMDVSNNELCVSNDDDNFSHTDLEMDEFDEFIGKLDEKSFLEDF